MSSNVKTNNQYRIYIDESHDNYSYFTLAGVFFTGCNREKVQWEFIEMKKEFFGCPYYGILPIIHMSSIKNDIKEYNKKYKKNIKIDKLTERYLHFIESSNFSLIIAGFPEHQKDEDLVNKYHYTLKEILSHFCRYLRENNGYGSIAFDNAEGELKKSIEEAYKKIREYGFDDISPEVVFQEYITCEDIDFLEKGKDVAGIQVADTAAYFYHRQYKKGRNLKEYESKYLEILKTKVCNINSIEESEQLPELES